MNKKAADSPPNDGPFHVLMAMAAPAFVPDPRMKRDYISRRAKAFGNSNEELTSPWDGVSRVERELVECCEQIEEDDQNAENNHPGALQIDKEVKFVGLLARDCHSMATRCLALAILEKTLEVYLHESESSSQPVADDEVDETGSTHDTDERSERARKRQRLNNQNQIPEKETFEEEEVTRLEQFLAAGGLKLLNRWLVEASTPEPVPSLKAPPGSNKKPPPPMTSKQSATRPLVIPILRFLEKIPFDRKVVVESKINKQIRKLGKLVDGILETRARGKHRPDDLENWTTEPVSSETDGLDRVKEAVQAVKSSWEEKAKQKPETFSAPFEPIKKTLRERLQTLLKYEAGGYPKPDWLEIEEPNKEAKKRASIKKKKTQDLAAKERKAEREGLKNRLHAAENEHRERLAKLREQLRKLKQEHAPSLAKPSTNNGRKVVWKDGMRSQTNRNRDLLEEVRMYIKNTPASSTAEATDELDEAANTTIGAAESEEGNNLVENALL